MKPLRCYLWGPRSYALARKLRDAGIITGKPCLGDDAAPAVAVSGTALLMVAGLAAIVFWPERKRRRR